MLVQRFIMRHFIWVFTVCQSTNLPVSRMKRINDYYSIIQLSICWFNASFETPFSNTFDCFHLTNSADPDEMPHFIWVFTACQSTNLPVSRMKRINDNYSMIQLSICWFNASFETPFSNTLAHIGHVTDLDSILANVDLSVTCFFFFAG